MKVGNRSGNKLIVKFFAVMLAVVLTTACLLITADAVMVWQPQTLTYIDVAGTYDSSAPSFTPNYIALGTSSARYRFSSASITSSLVSSGSYAGFFQLVINSGATPDNGASVRFVNSSNTISSFVIYYDAVTGKATPEYYAGLQLYADDGTPGGGGGGGGSVLGASESPAASPGQSIVTLKASDITTALNTAASSGSKTMTLNVDAPSTSTAVEVKLPTSSLKEIASSTTVQDLKFSTPVGSVTLDSKTLTSVAKQAGGSDVTIDVSLVDKSTLSSDMQSKAGSNGVVVDISILSNGTKIHTFDGGKVSVQMPYTLPAGQDPKAVTVWYVDEHGVLTQVEGATYDSATGTIIFTTDHLSLYMVHIWLNPYSDVTKTAWYYLDVSYVVTKGLFKGTSDTAFSPDSAMTRAMFVTVLGRFDGIKDASYTKSSFSDVQPGQWYSAAVEWASQNNIISGGGDGKFNPDAQITREEMAAILYRYEIFKKANVGATDSLSSYTDTAAISPWALDAVKWAVGSGLIKGTNALLTPQDIATRAQVAAIIHRLPA